LGTFNSLQIWRSVDGEEGEYTPLSAATVQPATLTGTEDGPFDVDGLTFELAVDGNTQLAELDSPDGSVASVVAAELDTLFIGASVSVSGGVLRIASDSTGSASRLTVGGGTAVTALGFVESDDAYGMELNLPLVGGTTAYTFVDLSGDPAYYYRYRYFHSGTGAVSAFSAPLQAVADRLLDSSDLILATLDLSDLDGNALADADVAIYLRYVPPLLVGSVAVLGKELLWTTDEDGHIEEYLPRGAVVDVAILGTNIVRQVTVPSTGTSFSLFDEVAAADDVFQIQVLDIPEAVRRS